MYLEASKRITIEILNVCGRLRETKREILNVFRIIKGKPRNVYEVNKREQKKVRMYVKATRERPKETFD